MINSILHKIKFAGVLISLIALAVSCERDISDDVVPATFPTLAEVYTDNPVGLTDEFFISFDPAAGANAEAFGTDDNVSFEGTSSIRIDVPGINDPNGTFVGGIFKDRGEGRNLTGYDALTFWIQGTLTGTVQVGFGTDFEDDKFPVSTTINLTTGWSKVVIPIPEPSKLVQEKGMFFFSAGSYDVLGNDNPAIGDSFQDNVGYTFWIDEIRFESLGTSLLTEASILNGQDLTQTSFVGGRIPIEGGSTRFNLANGQNINLITSTAYFDFENSAPSVATIDMSQRPIIDVIGESGTTTITASIQNVGAEGSVTVTSAGTFINADEPTLSESDVISIYSDTYSIIAGFNPGVFGATSNGLISAISFESNEHISYALIDNFVGIGWNDTIDVSDKTMIHLDIQLSGSTSGLIVELEDFGANQTDEPPFTPGSDDNSGGFNVTSQLIDGQWVGIDISLNSFTMTTGGGGTGNPALTNIGYITLVSNSPTAILIDNIYFY